MPLTPIDIQQKTFGPELRGYNMDEVDDFLDDVVATLKDYDQRVRDAQDRIRALEAEISTSGEDETAISRALVAAQKQADALLAEAKEDAERIRNEAYPEEEETPERGSEDEEIPDDDTWAESDDEEYSLEEADVPGTEETEEDVDDETWAEVEEAYEEDLTEEPAREHDLGELADELAGEAGSRSGQHLSSDENAPRSRRPWERGSV